LLSKGEVKQLEPEVKATAALISPSTGIIDVHSYMQSLLAQIQYQGGLFIANTEFIRANQDNGGFVVSLNSAGEPTQIICRHLINSAGLHATKVAERIECMPRTCIPQLHLCRGHYFSYSGKSPFSHLIYPIPDTYGLGIHASLDVGGQLKFGPDTQYIETLNYEVSATLRNKFYQAVKSYFPNVDIDRLQPAYSGIRPKMQGEGEGFADFVIQSAQDHGIDGLINLFGIDSPGMTSSLALAEAVESIVIG